MRTGRRAPAANFRSSVGEPVPPAPLSARRRRRRVRRCETTRPRSRLPHPLVRARFLRCDVATTCIGMAASMGACLLAAGSKGKRAVLQNSQVMLHQPLIGGVLQGPATDLGIEAAHMLRLRDRLYKLMSDFTGKPSDTIHRDFDRNKWLFAEEAVEYGCCDRVLDRAPESAPRRVEDNGREEKE